MWYGTGEADISLNLIIFKNKLNLKFQISIDDGKRKFKMKRIFIQSSQSLMNFFCVAKF